MKTYTIVITVLFVALCLLDITRLIETRKESNLKQKEIDGLKRTNEKQRDSLELILKLKNDSLTIAFETIRTASAEREEAHKRTQKTISDLRKIIFIQHSDSSRNVELSKLYPSYNPK